MSIRTTRTDTNGNKRYDPYDHKQQRATYGLAPFNKNSNGYAPEGTIPYYMSMNFGNMNDQSVRQLIVPDKISFRKKVHRDPFLKIFLFTPHINGVNKFTVTEITYNFFTANYKNNTFELYKYKNEKNLSYIYIFEVPISDNDHKKIIKLKENISKELNINFTDGRDSPDTPDILSELGGSAKPKKYVLYNNKRRLVKINNEKKKYIVCDKTDILLSTIKGKFR